MGAPEPKVDGVAAMPDEKEDRMQLITEEIRKQVAQTNQNKDF